MSSSPQQGQHLGGVGGAVVDDELEFACPNCGVVIGASEARPISIGCIVRSAVQSERMQRKALHSALSNDKSEIPPISQESMGEIFTSTSSRYTYFPPILTSMKFTIAEIQQKRALLKKIVRTCAACFERFVDDEEMRRQLHDGLSKLDGKAAQQKRSLSARRSTPQRLEPISPICSRKEMDRRTDMAFTDLQVTQRGSSRALQNKKIVREKLLHSIGGDTKALAIDWEVVPQMAIREMRRTANHLLEVKGGVGGGNNNASSSASSPPTANGGDVIFRRGKNTAPPPISYLGLGESPVTAFDVPLETRLMADLYSKVVGACEEFPTADTAVPINHPLFPVYRQYLNRLPAPPVPFVHGELPHPLELAPHAKQIAIPSGIRATEDAPVLASERKASVDRAVRGHGLELYTPGEMAMLASVIADDTIVVETDEDEEEEETDESDYDSEGWREEGGIYY